MEEEQKLTKKERRELAKDEKREVRQKQETFGKIKKFAISLLVFGAIAFAGYKVIGLFSTSESLPREPLQVVENDNFKGNQNASVVLFEYSDFQCPACASYQPLVKRIEEEFGDDIKIVFRHFPLVSIHPNAMSAAKAAESAGVQGKFWEMHDILFDRQQEWSGERNAKNKFIEYATELELDMEKFSSDMDSREVQEKITGQMLQANRMGLNSTPTFFLNDQRIFPRDYEDFSQTVERALGGE